MKVYFWFKKRASIPLAPCTCHKIYLVRSEFPAFGVNGFKIKADYVTIKSFIYLWFTCSVADSIFYGLFNLEFNYIVGKFIQKILSAKRTIR